MALTKIAVLMGGQSAEREVSLASGQAVSVALRLQGLDAQAVDVQSFADLQAVAEHYDCAFIALHGRWGEDGMVQAFLQDLGLPYTGSGMAASAIAMDKLRSKWLWMGAGLPTPGFQWVAPHQPFNLEQFALEFPVIVKPCHEGSSIGMRKAHNSDELNAAVQLAQQFDNEVLIEQWVTGREFTAAVLGDRVLPLIELQTSHDFYDYAAKYQANDTQYICPVDLPDAINSRIQKMVLEAFAVIGAQGWGRVDFMLDNNNQPWLIEINTVPGMTDHSLVPMAAKAAGIEFDELVTTILQQTHSTEKI